MSYNYEKEKPYLFTDKGQRLFIGMRDHIKNLLKTAGAFRAQEAMILPKGIGTTTTWEQMAVLDRLIELNEIIEIRSNCFSQHKIYTYRYD